jgi:hypothetical protein
MDGGIHGCDSEDTRALCWLWQITYALLAGTALLSLLIAFAAALVPIT